MDKYLVCEWAYSYGISLTEARRFTDEEKKRYADWFKETGFVSLGNHVDLEHVTWGELEPILNRPLNQTDGSFNGCGNQAYIINQSQWDALVSLNEKKGKELKEQKLAEKKESARKYIAWAEKYMESGQKLMTKDEYRRWARNYNNVMNEGGEGYIPDLPTLEAYEAAKEYIESL